MLQIEFKQSAADVLPYAKFTFPQMRLKLYYTCVDELRKFIETLNFRMTATKFTSNAHNMRNRDEMSVIAEKVFAVTTGCISPVGNTKRDITPKECAWVKHMYKTHDHPPALEPSTRGREKLSNFIDNITRRQYTSDSIMRLVNEMLE